MVVVYSRASCSPCRTLKYWLDKKVVAYEEKEPDASIVMVPTIEINGQRIEGLDFVSLVRLLAAQMPA